MRKSRPSERFRSRNLPGKGVDHEEIAISRTAGTWRHLHHLCGSPPRSGRPKWTLKYGNGQPAGKKSLGGSGEMIRFTLPDVASKVSGIRIHGSRYGMPEAPKESFLIYFLNHDLSEVLHGDGSYLAF